VLVGVSVGVGEVPGVALILGVTVGVGVAVGVGVTHSNVTTIPLNISFLVAAE